MFEITPNDGATIQKTIYKDGAVFNIPPTATVKAAIINNDRTALLAGPVPVLETAAGSDWANSTVVAVFTPTDLAGITKPIDVILEIQIDDGTQIITGFDAGTVQIGLIT